MSCLCQSSEIKRACSFHSSHSPAGRAWPQTLHSLRTRTWPRRSDCHCSRSPLTTAWPRTHCPSSLSPSRNRLRCRLLSQLMQLALARAPRATEPVGQHRGRRLWHNACGPGGQRLQPAALLRPRAKPPPRPSRVTVSSLAATLQTSLEAIARGQTALERWLAALEVPGRPPAHPPPTRDAGFLLRGPGGGSPSAASAALQQAAAIAGAPRSNEQFRRREAGPPSGLPCTRPRPLRSWDIDFSAPRALRH